MSYFLYCYKSELGWPDLKEAKKVVDVKEGDQQRVADDKIKRTIANALMQNNPTLESPEIDIEELAEMQGISIEEAERDFNQVELHTPEGELSTQITIFDNIVIITVPLWYKDEEAEAVFKNVDAYTKAIRRVAGYFVYDPQTGYVYDPSLADFDSLLVYLRRAGVAPVKREQIRRKKPWWKLW
jgi:hypothetical protein